MNITYIALGVWGLIVIGGAIVMKPFSNNKTERVKFMDCRKEIDRLKKLDSNSNKSIF